MQPILLIPNELIIAKVIPIYKKGDKSNFANYRPISILRACSKIFEKLAYNRIINFLSIIYCLIINMGLEKGDQQIQLSILLWKKIMKQ